MSSKSKYFDNYNHKLTFVARLIAAPCRQHFIAWPSTVYAPEKLGHIIELGYIFGI